MTEAQRARAFAMRRAMDKHVAMIADTPAEINDTDNMECIRPWKPGLFNAGDVRMHEGDPYKCLQAHDSAGNPGWNPAATPALWMQYHGTTPETARPWVAPQGAHDMYKAGEYMIWTDGITKRCLEDTVYAPDVYPQAWEDV